VQFRFQRQTGSVLKGDKDWFVDASIGWQTLAPHLIGLGCSEGLELRK